MRPGVFRLCRRPHPNGRRRRRLYITGQRPAGDDERADPFLPRRLDYASGAGASILRCIQSLL